MSFLRRSNMSTRPVIEYYFSFISLWSYVGSRRFQRLVQDHNVQVIYKPVDLLHVFSISGGLPVSKRSPQRQAYRLLEMARWRELRDIPLNNHPKFYPVNPSLAHRVLLAAIEEAGSDDKAVQDFARKGLSAVWAEESDISDPDTIARVASESGLEGSRLLDRATHESGLSEKEAELTKEAVSRRIFGAPLYLLGKEEPFWGQDRLEMLDDVIKSGRDPIPLPTKLD